jgi:prepilin-type N-terminal cleavage/methylation domain-containing protein
MPRRARRFRFPTARHGMSLIEVLLSVAIVALLVTLVLSVYHTVTATLRSQQERQAGPAAAADALARMSRDLACTFTAWKDESTRFLLSPAGTNQGPGSAVSFCTAIRPAGETDPLWFELERVAYRVTVDEHREPVLVRERRPLAGPGSDAPPVTNTLAVGVEQFRVTVFDGTNWCESWPGAGSAVCPRAARIELLAAKANVTRNLQTEVFIPAGNVVTSRVIRMAR